MKFINLIVIVCLLSNAVFADCNFALDIKPLPGSVYQYTQACHIKVGQIVQDDKVKTQQVNDLTKAIQAKDLALTVSDARTKNWSDTAAGLEGRLQKVDSLQSHNEVLYFVLGFISASAAVYLAAKALGH